MLCSCVETPTEQKIVNIDKVTDGDLLVLCEGLMGYDNSSLTAILYNSGRIIEDYYASSNPNDKLGDTSNDIILKNDTAYIPSSMGAYIQVFNVKSAKATGVIPLPAGSMPRKMKIINDTMAVVSDLLNSRLIFINTSNHNIINTVGTGPQPEGIEVYQNYIFAANSAYGDFNWEHPDAETISVIDISLMKEIAKIKAGTNVIELLVNHKLKRLYAAYINLPSRKDSSGGIIEYSLENFNKLREWRLNPHSLSLSDDGDKLYLINQSSNNNDKWRGISVINLQNGNIHNIIENKSKDIWYSLLINSYDNTALIGNAGNHNQKGEILLYNLDNPEKAIRKFPTGINPNTIIKVKK